MLPQETWSSLKVKLWREIERSSGLQLKIEKFLAFESNPIGY